MAIRYPYRKPIIAKPAPISAMYSDPTAAILQTYIGSYGRLTAAGQNRLIRLLELAQRMTPDQITMAISEIGRMNATD